MEITSNKFYNYILLDPRKPFNWEYKGNQIEYMPFYVGKGSNSRVTDHYRNSCDDNSYTKNKIQKLKNGGFVPCYIVYNKNSKEDEAYQEEIQTIKFIKSVFGDVLTNMTGGGDSPPIRFGSDNNKSIPVYQYDLDGNFIAEHECARQAALSLGTSDYTHVCACCKLQRKTALGYVWRYYKQNQIDIKKSKWDRIKFSKLIAYNNTERHEFSSMKEAYAFLGVRNSGKINSVLKGDRKTYMGYYWEVK